MPEKGEKNQEINGKKDLRVGKGKQIFNQIQKEKHLRMAKGK